MHPSKFRVGEGDGHDLSFYRPKRQTVLYCSPEGKNCHKTDQIGGNLDSTPGRIEHPDRNAAKLNADMEVVSFKLFKVPTA